MNVYSDVIQAEQKQTKELNKVGYERYISPFTPMNNNKERLYCDEEHLQMTSVG